MVSAAAALFLLFTGGLFTVKTRFFYLRHLGGVFRGTLFRRSEKGGGLSGAQACACALSGTLGVGNIVGVAAAIRAGGAGAVFWLWVSALLSCTVKSAEIFLARTNPGTGPLGYLQKALPSFLVKMYRVLLVGVSLLLGDAAQAGAVTSSFPLSNPVTVRVASAVLAAVAGVFLLLPRDASTRFLSRLAPVMTLLYLGIGLCVVVKNGSEVPHALARIFTEAFCPRAVAGGTAAGAFLAALREGCSSGLFSHEAGLGSAAFAHGQTAEKPFDASLWGTAEVFADSVAVSGLTALCLLTSGADTVFDAFCTLLGGAGAWLCAVVVTLFALSSMVCWSFYGRLCVPKRFGTLYAALFLTAAYVGGVLPSDAVWNAAGLCNALALCVHLAALLLLRKDFFIIFKKTP